MEAHSQLQVAEKIVEAKRVVILVINPKDGDFNHVLSRKTQINK